jgi:hypothetical protein
MIRKEGNEWVLYTSDGSRVLGRHKTKEEALRQERAIKAREARRAAGKSSRAAKQPRPVAGPGGRP